MAVTLSGYHIAACIPNTWTTLVQAVGTQIVGIRNLICSTSGIASDVSICITNNAGALQSYQLHNYNLTANESIIFGPQDLLLVLRDQNHLKVLTTASGVSFYAGGGYE